jgi:hypothetical protein
MSFPSPPLSTVKTVLTNPQLRRLLQLRRLRKRLHPARLHTLLHRLLLLVNRIFHLLLPNIPNVPNVPNLVLRLLLPNIPNIPNLIHHNIDWNYNHHHRLHNRDQDFHYYVLPNPNRHWYAATTSFQRNYDQQLKPGWW